MARERTALGWQRTSLSVAAAAAVLVRLTWGQASPLTIGVLAAVVALGPVIPRCAADRRPAVLTAAVLVLSLAVLVEVLG